MSVDGADFKKYCEQCRSLTSAQAENIRMTWAKWFESWAGATSAEDISAETTQEEPEVSRDGVSVVAVSIYKSER